MVGLIAIAPRIRFPVDFAIVPSWIISENLVVLMIRSAIESSIRARFAQSFLTNLDALDRACEAPLSDARETLALFGAFFAP
jgi:hypothetical protein